MDQAAEGRRKASDGLEAVSHTRFNPNPTKSNHQDGLAKAAAELRDKGIQVPSTKTFLTKPEILGQRRREADVDALPDLL